MTAEPDRMRRTAIVLWLLLAPAVAALLATHALGAPAWTGPVAYILVGATAFAVHLRALRHAGADPGWRSFERDFWAHVERAERSRGG